MPSRASTFLGYLGFDLSSQVSLMRSSYYRSTVIPLYSRITYGGDFGSSGVMDYFSKSSGTGDAAVFNIGDNGIGIFLIFPRVGISLC